MTIFRCDAVLLAFTGLATLLAGCDTDMYHDTSGCRDESEQTECPIDAPEKDTQNIQQSTKVKK